MKTLRLTPDEAKRLWDARQAESDLRDDRINPALPTAMAWEAERLLSDRGICGSFLHCTVTAGEPNVYELFYEPIENGA